MTPEVEQANLPSSTVLLSFLYTCPLWTAVFVETATGQPAGPTCSPEWLAILHQHVSHVSDKRQADALAAAICGGHRNGSLPGVQWWGFDEPADPDLEKDMNILDSSACGAQMGDTSHPMVSYQLERFFGAAPSKHFGYC